MVNRDEFKVKIGKFVVDCSNGFPVWRRETQTAHGFSVGQVIYHTGTAFALAKADAAATAEAVGIVWKASADEFIYVKSGAINDLSGLVSGTVYYLSADDAGVLVDVRPADGKVVKPILRATSATTGDVIDYAGTIVVKTNFEDLALNAGETDILDQIDKTETFGCAWHVAVRASDKSAMRTSIVHACWRDDVGSNNVIYEEVGTGNLGGSTADIEITVDISGSSARLLAINGGVVNGWVVRAKRIEI